MQNLERPIIKKESVSQLPHEIVVVLAMEMIPLLANH